MSDILPNYRPDDLNAIYRLHETDPHPNALANELIAQFVFEEVLRSRQPEPEVDIGMPARPGTCHASARA
jgi:hypothetical protein